MRRVLITGITGQDGGYLAEQLAAEGAEVHGLVRPGDVRPAHLRACGDALVLHSVDLADAAGVSEAFRAAAPDEVYNLAGVSSVALSWSEPGTTAWVNGAFAAGLLHLAWDERERTGRDVHFVQASSAEIYAGADEVPQDESTPIRPRSPYGASKAFAHHLVQVFRQRGMFATNVVLYNHESPRRPLSFVTRKITSTAAAIASGFATELVLGNLEARRDWGWAPEYVDAMTRAARQQVPDDFVLATGISHSVADFVASAFRHVGIAEWEQYVRTDPRFVRPADAVDLVGRADHADERLGWRPAVPFDEVVRRMVLCDLDRFESPSG